MATDIRKPGWGFVPGIVLAIGLTFSVTGKADAQSRSGVSTASSGGVNYSVYKHKRRVGIIRNKPVRFNRKNRRIVRERRAGVRLGNRRSVSGAKIYRNNHFRRSGVIRSTLADRNREFRADQSKYRNNRQQEYVYDGESGYYITVAPRRPKVIAPCPTGFNCGYRLYENRTGPRIIVPGVSGEGLPPQDGLDGPRIIRVQ